MTDTTKPDQIVIELDFDALELGDLELFEDATGQNLFEAIEPQIVRDENGRPVKDPDDPKGRPLRQMKVSASVLVALVYIVMKKDDPAITLAEVRRVPLRRLDFRMANVPDDEADAEDPTEESESEQTSVPAD
jgi:hypothetical protein